MKKSAFILDLAQRIFSRRYSIGHKILCITYLDECYGRDFIIGNNKQIIIALCLFAAILQDEGQ